MNTALRHKVRVFKGLLLVLLSVLLTVLGAMLFEVYASVRGVDISTLLFYLSIGTEELTNYSVVSTTIEAGLKLAFFALLLLSWLWLSYGLQHTSIELCIFFFRFHWKLRIFSLFRLKKALLLLFPAAWILIDLVLIFFAIGMPQYLSILGKESTIYDNFYTDPATQNIQLPETKRNIIHIVLESMETTYED